MRKLLVHGARSCFRHLDRTRDRLALLGGDQRTG
ncbi:MAG TPA: hypothetical protein VNZ93_24855 [Pseudorhodoplanes sp.]|nr:hypothetical protein [Pseudorhodoplanes sp.]HWV55809.1 hypothetical protein [Pseudorhodoplanes sp.]